MSNSAGTGEHQWDQYPKRPINFESMRLSMVKTLLERPIAGLAIYCLLILFVYLLIEQCLAATLAVPFSAYSAPSLTFEAIQHFGWTSRILLALFAVALVLLDPARMRWQDFSGGTLLRWVVVLLAVLMAWPFTTYGFNYAVDAGHLIDRGMLAAALLLLYWRPVFVFPFLLLAYLILGQLTAPSIGGSVLPHKTQVLRALELFAAFYFVRVVTGYHRTGGYIFLLGCFVAAAYWLPAWAKFQLDWLSGNQLELIPLAAYAHGWRGDQNVQSVVELGQQLQPLAVWLKASAFIIEALFVVFFFRYRMALVLLLAAIVFHLGVFYLYGFLFWTWIALDFVLLGLLIFARRSTWTPDIFGLRYVPLAAGLILAGPLWAKPPALGWYDTPLSYAYAIEAELTSGETVDLNPKFFAPYEDAFTMTGFGYLVSEHGVLVGPYGTTHDDSIHRSLSEARTPASVFALEQQNASNSYNEHRAKRFYQFVENFVRRRNVRGDMQKALYALHSPVQFWSDRGGLSQLGDMQISSVTVIEKTWFYDGETLSQIRTLPLHTIDVSAARD